MAENSIGTARLDITVDTAQFDAAIAAAKRSVSSMSAEAQAEYSKLNTAEKRRVDSYIQQTDKINLTKQQTIAYNAALRGTPVAILDDLKVKLAASGSAAGVAAKQFDQYGMSSKATAAAMRNVPAQITDIVVGLQGGQAPLTVLLQQGGQLKDMFGGVVPAAKALGSAVLGIVNPFTLVAAGIGLFAYAASAGAREANTFSQTLITSGNVSGRTAGQLSDLATRIGDISGSRAKAVDALNLIASSSLGAGDNISRIASAAVEMNRAVGREVGETVKEFEDLGKSPTEALYKLNQQYNFLTSSVYEQVASLEQQGRKQEAARIAQDAYASSVEQSTMRVRGNLGLLERSWDAITAKAAKAWEVMKGIGAPDTFADVNAQLKAVNGRIAEINAAGASFGNTGGGAATGDGGRAARIRAGKDQKELNGLIAQAGMLQIQADAAALQGLAQRTENARTEAVRRLQILDRETESNADRRKREIDQVKKDASLTEESAEKTADRIAAINEKYKDPKGGGTKAYRDDAGARMLLQLKEQEASLRAQAEGETKITDAQKDRVKFEQQLSDLKEKKILTADQKSLLANQDAIRAQLDKNAAVATEVTTRQALIKLEERSAQIQASIASAQASRQEQYDRTLGAYGLGDRAQQRVQSETGIRREFQRSQDQLNKSTPENLIGSDQYKAASDAIINGQNSALASLEKYYARADAIINGQNSALASLEKYYAAEDELRGSWELGFQSSFASYAEVAADSYQSAGAVFGTFVGGMEDSFSKFVTTGKLSFSDLANSIIADLARIAARQAIVGAIGSVMGAFASAGTASASSVATASQVQQGGGDGIGALIALTGGRAIGGPVAGGSMYEVNERGPELLNTSGKQYLMMGQESGSVTPLKAMNASGNSGGVASQISVSINIADGGTETNASDGYQDFARDIGAMVDARFRQLEAKSQRQGGTAWNARNGRG